VATRTVTEGAANEELTWAGSRRRTGCCGLTAGRPRSRSRSSARPARTARREPTVPSSK